MQPPLRLRALARGAAGATLGAVLLSACGGNGGSPGPIRTPATTPRPDLVAQLDDLPQGVVRLQVEAGSRRLLAHLDVSGLVPSSAHAVQLHRGTCLQRGGALIAAFGDATSNAAGTMSADVSASPAPLGGTEYLELHLVGAAQLAAHAIPLACADIPAGAPTAAARITATPGYKPFGTVTVSYSASSGAAAIDVAVQALVPGTAHAVQILAGTCAAPGALVHDAGDVTADAAGTVRTRLTVAAAGGPPPAAGWIVMVRSGAGAALGTASQPSPQAQPILCGALAKPQ